MRVLAIGADQRKAEHDRRAGVGGQGALDYPRRHRGARDKHHTDVTPQGELASGSLANSTCTSSSAVALDSVPAFDVTATPALRDRKRYQILGEHGRGGLGRVSRARDVELGRDVAIKELIARSDTSSIGDTFATFGFYDEIELWSSTTMTRARDFKTGQGSVASIALIGDTGDVIGSGQKPQRRHRLAQA